MSRHESSGTSIEEQIAQAVAEIIEYKDWIGYKDLVGYLTSPNRLLSKASASQKADIVIAKIQIHRYYLQAHTILSLIGQGGLLEGADINKKILLFSKWLEQRDSFISFQDLANLFEGENIFSKISPQEQQKLVWSLRQKEDARKREVPIEQQMLETLKKNVRKLKEEKLEKQRIADEESSLRWAEMEEVARQKKLLTPRESAPISFEDLAYSLNNNSLDVESRLDKIHGWIEANKEVTKKWGFADKLFNLFFISDVLNITSCTKRVESFVVCLKLAGNNIELQKFLSIFSLGTYPDLSGNKKLSIFLKWVEMPSSVITHDQFLDLFRQDNLFSMLDYKNRSDAVLKFLELGRNIPAEDFANLFQEEDMFCETPAKEKILIVQEWLEKPGNTLDKDNLMKIFIGNGRDDNDKTQFDAGQRVTIIFDIFKKTDDKQRKLELLQFFAEEPLLKNFDPKELILNWLQEKDNNLTKKEFGILFESGIWNDLNEARQIVGLWVSKQKDEKLNLEIVEKGVEVLINKTKQEKEFSSSSVASANAKALDQERPELLTHTSS